MHKSVAKVERNGSNKLSGTSSHLDITHNMYKTLVMDTDYLSYIIYYYTQH